MFKTNLVASGGGDFELRCHKSAQKFAVFVINIYVVIAHRALHDDFVSEGLRVSSSRATAKLVTPPHLLESKFHISVV